MNKSLYTKRQGKHIYLLYQNYKTEIQTMILQDKQQQQQQHVEPLLLTCLTESSFFFSVANQKSLTRLSGFNNSVFTLMVINKLAEIWRAQLHCSQFLFDTSTLVYLLRRIKCYGSASE